jgi:hypothetical protein
MYSHTWIEYPSVTWGGRWGLHSVPDGVVMVPIEQVYASYVRRITYRCDQPFVGGFAWARERINAGYDFGVLCNIVLLLLFRFTGREYLRKAALRDASRYTCSELVSGFLKASSIPGTEDFDPELETPGGLERYCSSSPHFQVIE